MESPIELGIILVVAFVPAIIYMLWIRSAEVHEREPFLAVEGVFIYGLVVALGMAFVLEVVAMIALRSIGGGMLDPQAGTVLMAVVLAPLIEEFTKLTGVFTVTRRLTEPENGPTM